jgi:hypothetical protein
MTNIITLHTLLLCTNLSTISPAHIEHVADAIYRVEGGSKARVPYGILSVKVSGEVEARRVCKNTIRNNHIRWKAAGHKECYLDFLADKYCPPSVDKQGNINWKKNIHKILRER